MSKKLKLEDLKVQSFVTGLNNEQTSKTYKIKGGFPILSASCTVCTIISIATEITKGDCDIPTIGHDDGPYCISKEADWCHGR